MGQASKKAQGLSSYLTTKQPEPLPDAPPMTAPRMPWQCLQQNRREIKSKFASPLLSAGALGFNLHFICRALAYNIVEMPRPPSLPSHPTCFFSALTPRMPQDPGTLQRELAPSRA